MIAVGQGLRGIANKGFSAVSRAETIEEQQRLGIEASEKAAESQLLGTGAGIGGMSGAKAAGELRTASKALQASNEAAQGINNIGSTVEGLSKGTELLNTGSEISGTINNVGSTVEGLSKGTELLNTGSEIGSTINNVAPALEGITATGEGLAITGEAVVAAEGAAAVGPMAQLSALAAPVAIGLGVAFLLNKLF
jgi:hypothetical protein